MVERLLDAVHVGEEAVVAGEFLEAALFGRAEQLDRAVVERLEQVRVDAAEQGDGLVVPAPPQVVGEGLKGVQPRRGARQDRERANRTDGHEQFLLRPDKLAKPRKQFNFHRTAPRPPQRRKK